MITERRKPILISRSQHSHTEYTVELTTRCILARSHADGTATSDPYTHQLLRIQGKDWLASYLWDNVCDRGRCNLVSCVIMQVE